MREKKFERVAGRWYEQELCAYVMTVFLEAFDQLLGQQFEGPWATRFLVLMILGERRKGSGITWLGTSLREDVSWVSLKALRNEYGPTHRSAGYCFSTSLRFHLSTSVHPRHTANPDHMDYFINTLHHHHKL